MTMGKENMKDSVPHDLPPTPFLEHLKEQMGSPYRTCEIVHMIGNLEEIHNEEANLETKLCRLVIDCFEKALDPDKDPRERRFDDYKWVFDLEIKQLADEYELRIGKKGYILDMILENSKNIQGKMQVCDKKHWKKRSWFRWISFDYRATLGFGSIAGSLDHVNPVIRLPLECRISMVLGKDDHSNPSVGTNPVTASIT
ncbi:hypothetical protein Tco_1043838 [Tanacetum coccineum]|uniref:Uncharacterized protein n=1 Tax=Tanacetum coccineum TaxID=301880 RepID=A0ABQ5GN78_9ASTR